MAERNGLDIASLERQLVKDGSVKNDHRKGDTRVSTGKATSSVATDEATTTPPGAILCRNQRSRTKEEDISPTKLVPNTQQKQCRDSSSDVEGTALAPSIDPDFVDVPEVYILRPKKCPTWSEASQSDDEESIVADNVCLRRVASEPMLLVNSFADLYRNEGEIVTSCYAERRLMHFTPIVPGVSLDCAVGNGVEIGSEKSQLNKANLQDTTVAFTDVLSKLINSVEEAPGTGVKTQDLLMIKPSAGIAACSSETEVVLKSCDGCDYETSKAVIESAGVECMCCQGSKLQ